MHPKTGSQAAGRHDRDLHALAIDDGAGTVFAFAELGTGSFVWIASSTPLFMVVSAIGSYGHDPQSIRAREQVANSW